MGRLTTHVLDLVHGRPGAGIDIDLYRIEHQRVFIKSDRTNLDGRCDDPIAEGSVFARATYEVVFHVGKYFESMGITQDQPKFLDEVVIRFGVSDEDQHYHVPLLLSLYGYSTYRGS